MTDSSFSSTRIHLESRPQGWPEATDFSVRTHEYGSLEPGEVRVVNEFVSVDPYMRGRMSGARSYVEPYEVGATITGAAVGRVVASADESLPEGTPVLHGHGWTDAVQDAASTFQPVRELEGHPLSIYLGILGMTGLTAYVGLTRFGELHAGDTVFVSGAAGAVGTAVGQIAPLLGAKRVIGSAGSSEKVAALTNEFGYDIALNYREAPIREQLVSRFKEEGIDGVDLFFDNVGGDHLEAALEVMNDYGRVILCGAISGYNATQRPTGPDNIANVLTRRLRMQGFIVAEHQELGAEFRERMGGWLQEGRIRYEETVVDGFENTVEAFISMMGGANTGKMVVRLR